MKTKWLWVTALCIAAGCGSDPKRVNGDGSGDGVGSGGGKNRDGGAGGSVEEWGGGCAEYKVRSELVTPAMLIVLDRSASMAPDGNDRGTDRWRGSVEAVVEVTGSFDRGIDFGLMTFPGASATGNGRGRGSPDATLNCTPGAMNVPIASNSGDQIAQALSGISTGGYTPTAATLDAALAVIGPGGFADQGATPPGYVLLVTDGDPNCSGNLNGPLTADPQARQDTIAAIERLYAQGVQTYVVGYQTAQTSFAGTLDAMAVAGGTGDVTHHSVETGADLQAVFEEIAGRALSCSFKLASRVTDPTYVSVTVAGKARQYQNAADGWTLGGDQLTITLTGGACEAVQKGATLNVSVSCEPVFGI